MREGEGREITGERKEGMEDWGGNGRENRGKLFTPILIIPMHKFTESVHKASRCDPSQITCPWNDIFQDRSWEYRGHKRFNFIEYNTFALP